jgi:hypothetical protein
MSEPPPSNWWMPWDGPSLRDAARAALGDKPGYTGYRYCDADGTTQPAYAATHVEVWAAQIDGSAPLEPIASGLRAIPGFVQVTRTVTVEESRKPGLNLRPQVRALFLRQMDVT